MVHTMKKYNIFTVANEGYASFLKMFVGSIFDKVDLDNINKIVIADTGLSDSTLEFLSVFPKLIIQKTNIETKYSKIHDHDWKKNVYSKSKLLLDCISHEDDFVPTIMIDSDCVIIEDFVELIDSIQSDIIPCLRNQAGRTPGHQATSTHIGSFFVAKTEKSIEFIKDWISEIPKITTIGPDGKRIPQESPALSNICNKYKDKIDIYDLDERIIANIEHDPPDFAKIYHLKSDWMFLTVDRRISQPRVSYYKRRYL